MADNFDDDDLPADPKFRVTRGNDDNDLEDLTASDEENDLGSWTERAKVHTIRAAREVRADLTRSKKEYDEALWRNLVRAYVLAKIVSGPGRKWGEFVNDRGCVETA